MRRTTITAVLLTPALLLLAACTSTSGSRTPVAASTSSCEAALVAQLKAAADPNSPSGTKPPACDGLADATITQLADQAAATVFGGMASSTAFPTSLPTDFPTSG